MTESESDSGTEFDFSKVVIGDGDLPPDSDTEIIKPHPPDIPLDGEAVNHETAADRVRARFRGFNGVGSGAANGEPSTNSRARSRPLTAKDIPGKPREGSLVKPLTELYMGLGLMLAPIDPVCSSAFINNAENCAKSLETLARENESVRRAILALTQTSAWGGAIIAHLPILLMVMTHHGPSQMRERTAAAALLMNPAAMQHFNNNNEKPE